jgi:hypothetical protein
MDFLLDRETFLRCLQKPNNISRLVYAGPSRTLMEQLPSGADIPLEAVWYAVIIPEKPIANINKLMFKDFRYFLITGESLGLKRGRGVMFLAFDFDTPPTKTGLSFPFIFAEDAEWLHVLVIVKRLAIYDSPNGSLQHAMLLEFDDVGLKPVEDWLKSCGEK